MVFDMNYIKGEIVKIFREKNYIIEETTEDSIKFKYCGVLFETKYSNTDVCTLIQYDQNGEVDVKKEYANILRLLQDVYFIEDFIKKEVDDILEKANNLCDVLEKKETELKRNYNALKDSNSLEVYNKIKELQNTYSSIYDVIYNLENNYITIGKATETLNSLELGVIF